MHIYSAAVSFIQNVRHLLPRQTRESVNEGGGGAPPSSLPGASIHLISLAPPTFLLNFGIYYPINEINQGMQTKLLRGT